MQLVGIQKLVIWLERIQGWQVALSWAAPVWHLEDGSVSQNVAGTGHVSHQEETVSTT